MTYLKSPDAPIIGRPVTRPVALEPIYHQFGESEQAEQMADALKAAWDTYEELIRSFGLTLARTMLLARSSFSEEEYMRDNDPRPTIRDVMEQQGFSLKEIQKTIISLFDEDVARVVMEGIGTPEEVDCCLNALSYLSHRCYTRKQVGGFTFLASQSQRESRELRIPTTTPQKVCEQLREYGAELDETPRQPDIASYTSLTLPFFLLLRLPLGTYRAAFDTRGYQGTQVQCGDLMMVLPYGLLLHVRRRSIPLLTYDMIEGVYRCDRYGGPEGWPYEHPAPPELI